MAFTSIPIEKIQVNVGRMIVKITTNDEEGHFIIPNEKNNQWAQIVRLGPCSDRYIIKGVEEGHHALVPVGAGIIMDDILQPDDDNVHYRIMYQNEAQCFIDQIPTE